MKDETGSRFGRLVVTCRVGRDKHGNFRYKCLCDCGTEKEIIGGSLRNGITSSCGCLQKERAVSAKTTHGNYGTSTYKIWRKMKERCSNPNDISYPNYGGKGITVCDRWLKFENFLEDMKERPDGMTLDRKNGSKGYSKDNCKWSTLVEQARNKKNNVSLTLTGVTRLAIEWSEELGIPLKRLLQRKSRGWEDERILTEAPRMTTHTKFL